MCTGVDLGDIKGDAGGDCGKLWRGEIGWKEKCRLLEPGDGGIGHVPPGVEVWVTIAAGSETMRGLNETLRLVCKLVLRLRVELVSVGSITSPAAVYPTELTTSNFGSRRGRLVRLNAPPPALIVGDFKFFSSSCLN